jgi:transcription antitermination factor NusG
MPLLPRETDILPEDLFTLATDAFPWGVAHVRSRQEKVLARHLAEHGIPFYLPLTESRRKSAGRTLTSHLPLFAGYVFHRATGAQRDLLWRSNVIANLIDVGDQSELGAELAQLRQLQLAGASLKTYHELAPGQPVRIESGPFAGYRGVVVRGRSRDRLIVQISLLRQSVAVEFDREVLRRVR